MLVDLPKLITAYNTERPDPTIASQRVAFGTSGHRGSSFERSFNEAHVLAITQAICGYRKQQGVTGPLFLGFDTHALSAPAFASALEVLAANDVEAMIAKGDEYTPTPAISHAILVHNKGRQSGLADGIVITREFTWQFRAPCFERIDAAATPAQKKLLSQLTPDQVRSADLAGEKIETILTRAPGQSPIHGLPDNHSRCE